MISHFLQIPGGVLFFYQRTHTQKNILRHTMNMEKKDYLHASFFLFWREIIQLSLIYIKWRKLKEKQMSCPEYIILLFGKSRTKSGKVIHHLNSNGNTILLLQFSYVQCSEQTFIMDCTEKQICTFI